jgi:hypothetical protein
MANRALRTALAGITAAVIAGSAAAGGYRAPRTAYGQPDLQGLWSNAWLTKLERPERFKALEASEAEAQSYERSPPPLVTDDVGGNESEVWEVGSRLARIGGRARTSIIVDPADGRLPYTAAGADAAKGIIQRASKNLDGPEPRTTSEQCLVGNTTGPPMLTEPYNNNIQIVQTRDSVVFLLEWNHEARIVRLGDRRHAPPVIRPWMGDAVGWWEGETLVVETTNFNPGQRLRRSQTDGYYVSPEARIVERFTKTSPTEILYQFSIDDPDVYRQTWRGEAPFVATSARTFEFACHEGNYSLTNVLAIARAAERTTEAAAK